MLARSAINLEFNKETGEHYIVWEPVVIAAGKTRQKALEDLRTAAHFCIDTMVDLKLKNLRKNKED